MTFSFGCDCYNCEFVEAQIVFTVQPGEVRVTLVRMRTFYEVFFAVWSADEHFTIIL